MTPASLSKQNPTSQLRKLNSTKMEIGREHFIIFLSEPLFTSSHKHLSINDNFPHLFLILGPIRAGITVDIVNRGTSQL